MMNNNIEDLLDQVIESQDEIIELLPESGAEHESIGRKLHAILALQSEIIAELGLENETTAGLFQDILLNEKFEIVFPNEDQE